MEQKRHATKNRVITVKITESELERIDFYADKSNLNRSQLVRNLVRSGLDDLKLMNRTGLLTMALKGVDLLDHVKKSLGKEKYQVKNGKVIIDL
jgi:metal-responsive CopG/Arc/MetJ family transcriptional regulator